MKVSDVSNCCELIGGEGDEWRRYLDFQESLVETRPAGVRDHMGKEFRRPRGSRLHYGLYHDVLAKSWPEVMKDPFPAGLQVKNSCGVCHELNHHCLGSPTRFPNACRFSLGNALCVHQEDAHLLTTVERLALIGKAYGWIDPEVANKILAQALVYVDTGGRIDGIAVRANAFEKIHEDERGSFFLDVQREKWIFSPGVINLINQTNFKMRNFDSKEDIRKMIRPLQHAFGKMVSRCLSDAGCVLEEMGEKELKTPLLGAKDICDHFDTDNLGKVVRQLYYDPANIPLN